MYQENTKLCDFSNTNNNDFISTPIAPATSAESLWKNNFLAFPVKMVHPI